MKYYVFLFFFLLASCPARAESRIKIAIVDSGISREPAVLPFLCAEGHRDFTGKGLDDVLGHGTAVAMLAVHDLSPKRYCLLIFKWLHLRGGPNSELYVTAAIRAAIREGAAFINLSLSGPGTYAEEQVALQDALRHGITVVIAAGNDERDLSKNCNVYPACHPIKDPRLHVVGNSLGMSTNYGGPITDWAPGNAMEKYCEAFGTSFSAPRILNQLARKYVRH